MRAPRSSLRGPRAAPTLQRRDWPWLAGSIVAGGIFAPTLLMIGLLRAGAAGTCIGTERSLRRAVWTTIGAQSIAANKTDIREIHNMNKKLQLTAYVLTCALSLAATAAYADNMQQSKMKTCNANAATQKLAGDDRKAYMKTCLSAKPAAASTGNSQQQKMKTCNADATAKKLTGADRKTYMKTCLSAAPADGSSSAVTPTPPATSAPVSTPVPAVK